MLFEVLNTVAEMKWLFVVTLPSHDAMVTPFPNTLSCPTRHVLEEERRIEPGFSSLSISNVVAEAQQALQTPK